VDSLGGAGGFSGAKFWRLATQRGVLCLRSWPPQADPAWPARLKWIDAVLEHVARHGFSIVPAPIRTRRGSSFVEHDQRLWELSPWLPGRADYFPLRRTEKLQAALIALARFHIAAAEFGGGTATSGPSPGIRQRSEQIDALRAGRWHTIVAAVDAASLAGVPSNDAARIAIGQLARRWLPLFEEVAPMVRHRLTEAEPLRVPLQACIRDIWHDHVLFEDDRVSGLVDFGAMRVGNVAGDVARLLGSMAGDDASVWQAGLAAYESVRPLSADERRLVGVFDRSTTLLSGINWLQWIFVEGRTFSDLAAVAERLREILARLECLKMARG
jgi:Ser/Thr protein kinase RdoA (MazF antagonist)